MQKWTSSKELLFNRNATIEFSNLAQDSGDGQKAIVAKGTWRLKFVVRYENSAKTVLVDHVIVKDRDGVGYQLEKVELSPVGIHFDMTVHNPHKNGVFHEQIYQGFTLFVVLEDHTEIKVENMNLSANGDLDSSTLTADFGAMFDVPISMKNIVALRICNTFVEIP